MQQGLLGPGAGEWDWGRVGRNAATWMQNPGSHCEGEGGLGSDLAGGGDRVGEERLPRLRERRPRPRASSQMLSQPWRWRKTVDPKKPPR